MQRPEQHHAGEGDQRPDEFHPPDREDRPELRRLDQADGIDDHDAGERGLRHQTHRPAQQQHGEQRGTGGHQSRELGSRTRPAG